MKTVFFSWFNVLLSTLAVLLPQAVLAARVDLASVTASTSLEPAEGVSYEPSNLTDGKVSTVWVEGEEGSGLGSWILIDLGGSRDIESITLWNGNWYSWDFWNRHNRIKDLEVELADGTTHKFTLKDQKIPETIRFPAVVHTDSLKLKIKSVYAGTTFHDTCLSELEVDDSSPESWLKPYGYSDSGHLAEDADGTYEVSNTYDGILDTMWCENQRNGDGTGSWIEYHFNSTVRPSTLHLRNGNTYSLGFWMKSNRAKSAELLFSDGSRQTISIKDTLMEQSIPVLPNATTSIRITFTQVTKGKEYNDLCISEAFFE